MKPIRPIACRIQAFTLLELILAVAIMAVVMIAINAAFFSAMRLHDHTLSAVDEALPMQQAMATLRRDLEGAMPPGTNGIMAGDFKVGDVSTLGLNQAANIEMYTTTGALRDHEPWGEVQRVTYELRPSADRTAPGRDLYRSVTRNLLATVTPQPEDQWMMDGVESLEFSCYDGTQWRDYWDTTLGDTNLPSAVRVKLVLAGGDPVNPKSIQITVPIDSQSRTNQSL